MVAFKLATGPISTPPRIFYLPVGKNYNIKIEKSQMKCRICFSDCAEVVQKIIAASMNKVFHQKNCAPKYEGGC